MFKAFFRIWLIVNPSLNKNSPDILPICETNLDDSNDSGNFSVRGYLPLIRKNSSTHAWSHSYVKEGLPFAWKAFYRQRIPESSCVRKETVDIDILVQMNIYQSNTYRKDLSWLHFNNEPKVQERQQVKDQQSCIS